MVEEGIPFAIVATKIDKLKKSEVQKNLRVIQEAYGLPSRLFLPFSAVTGEGKRDVWRLIRSSVLSQGPAYEGLEMDETDEEEEDDGRYIIESADDENEETGDDYEDEDDDGTIDRDLINP